MPLAPGIRLGVYEVVGAIGAGGMGEVYRAHDTTLDRDVAIKVLPDAFAADAERLARFEREARLLASLNHPNIAAIYGLERSASATCLVMELAAGETLAARIARTAGPWTTVGGRRAMGAGLPLEEALPIALQIAAGLEAAHEKGIVHRDLKPANIVVGTDGKVKVLDFGLAKLAGEAEGVAQDFSPANSPTMAHAGTMAGVILGTAAYMSPEQARGKLVDKRTDIWAFGCVLFEMLTGRPAFAGETLTDIVAAVVKNEPEWNALPLETPAAVRSVLRRCLKKDPAERLHDVADARIEIGEAHAEPAAFADGIPARRRLSPFGHVVPWTLAALAIVALTVTQFVPRRAASPTPRVARLELNMPAGVEASVTNTPNMAISPDGTRVAFVGGVGGLRRLYLRRFDEFEAAPLRGTETVNVCVFSPDGSALAFITSNRVLKKVSLADGLVTTVNGDAESIGGGVAWGPDDRITFGRGGALWQVPAVGGPARQLTTLDRVKNELLHDHSSIVAGGSAILFTSVIGDDRTTTHIEAVSLATGRRVGVVDKGSNPIYMPSGHLIFFRDGALLAAPFDVDKLQVTGPTVAVLENISLDQLGNPMLAVSSAGSLAYIPSANATKRLVWVSRQGVEEQITDTSRRYQNPRIAPDQHRIVVEIAGGDLWIQDATRATFTRLTSGDTIGNSFSVWTPDARRIVFHTLTGLRWIDADGSGGSHGIPGTSVSDIPSSISPDGRTLAFVRPLAETGGDIYTLSLQGDPQPRPLVRTSGYDGGGQFSPDGRWMAYVTNESGQFEVYVRPYPGPDRKVLVSTRGGTHPKWNKNGKELFYRDGNKMMVVDVTTAAPGLTLSQPRVLFEQRYSFGNAQTIPNYDVSPDGQRFVMVKDDSSSDRLNIVLNWTEELKRLAPVK